MRIVSASLISTAYKLKRIIYQTLTGILLCLFLFSRLNCCLFGCLFFCNRLLNFCIRSVLRQNLFF